MSPQHSATKAHTEAMQSCRERKWGNRQAVMRPTTPVNTDAMPLRTTPRIVKIKATRPPETAQGWETNLPCVRTHIAGDVIERPIPVLEAGRLVRGGREIREIDATSCRAPSAAQKSTIATCMVDEFRLKPPSRSTSAGSEWAIAKCRTPCSRWRLPR